MVMVIFAFTEAVFNPIFDFDVKVWNKAAVWSVDRLATMPKVAHGEDSVAKPMTTRRSIQFFIPFEVAPKQADRSRIAATGQRQFIRHYQPIKIAKNHAALASLCSPHVPNKPLSGPLRAEYVFQFAWRKSESRKRKSAGSLWKDVRPDLGQLDKQIEDVLESAGFFRDDAQIVWRDSRKVFTDRPGVQVKIEELK